MVYNYYIIDEGNFLVVERKTGNIVFQTPREHVAQSVAGALNRGDVYFQGWTPDFIAHGNIAE